MFKVEATHSQIIGTTKISRSTWYAANSEKREDRRKYNKGRPKTRISKTLNGTTIDDSEVVRAIKNIRNEPFFTNGGGYKKITEYLRRDYGYHVNKKKVYRLCKENQLLLPQKIKRIKGRTPISINRVITAPLQLWELDIKYGYIMGERRFFFLMAIIDVYLRYVVGFHIGLRCLGSDLVRTLGMALDKMKIKSDHPVVIRMDNGPQMTSNIMFKFANEKSDKLIHELIPLQTPNKDAHIESFYSILETECFQTHVFQTYQEAYKTSYDFIDFYHSRRVHGSLGYRTPLECLELHKNGKLFGVKSIRL